MYALVNCDIYTGDGVEYNQALLIQDGRIHGMVPLDQLDPRIEQRDLHGSCVTPGWIDIQVNGGGGVLFNDSPTIEGLRCIVEAHQTYGTTNLLPTFITGPASDMLDAVQAVDAAMRTKAVRGILGIHLEGPFINHTRAGVHDRSCIREPNDEDLSIIRRLRDGVVLLTLAPEVASTEVIRRLSTDGILVSLGHTDATCEEAMAALNAGASCVTHLYNAMSQLTSRAPGVVGAALDHRDSWAGIILDGFHCDFVAARVAIRAKARRKTLLVTDAMPPVGLREPDLGFRLGPYEIKVKDGRCVTDDGVLAGSALDMATAVRNCVQKLGLPKDEVFRMASTYPAEFLGLGSELGRVARGYRANLTILNNQMLVSAVVVEGEYRDVA